MSIVAAKVADLQGVVEAMVDDDRCRAPLSGADLLAAAKAKSARLLDEVRRDGIPDPATSNDLRAIELALARYQNGLEDVIDSVRSALQHLG
jgi:hypothetical protein